jgi:hypothetical protein
MAKLRKQVSLDFLEYTKSSINELLGSNLPQSAKCKLSIMMEKLLNETKSYKGFKYLYWSKYGHEEWQFVKATKINSASIEIPNEYLYGPDDTGESDFVSDIQGKFSRKYF